MTHFDRNLNSEIVVEQVKLQERVLKFLQGKDFKTELERNCICFHQKLETENRLQEYCCEPFFVNLSLKFGEIEDGKNSAENIAFLGI